MDKIISPESKVRQTRPQKQYYRANRKRFNDFAGGGIVWHGLKTSNLLFQMPKKRDIEELCWENAGATI